MSYYLHLFMNFYLHLPKYAASFCYSAIFSASWVRIAAFHPYTDYRFVMRTSL